MCKGVYLQNDIVMTREEFDKQIEQGAREYTDYDPTDEYQQTHYPFIETAYHSYWEGARTARNIIQRQLLEEITNSYLTDSNLFNQEQKEYLAKIFTNMT